MFECRLERAARRAKLVFTVVGSDVMGMANVTWEDEENNRHVSFSVAYAIENEGLSIREITPQSVAFLCEQRTRPVRSIGVHTVAGQRMLSRQFQQSSQFAALAGQLAQGGTSLTA